MKLQRRLIALAGLTLALTVAPRLDASASRMGRLGSRLSSALGTSVRTTPAPTTSARTRATRTPQALRNSDNGSHNGSSGARSHTWARSGAGLLLATALGGYVAENDVEHDDVQTAWEGEIDSYLAPLLIKEHLTSLSSIEDIGRLIETPGLVEDGKVDAKKASYVLTKISKAMADSTVIAHVNPDIVDVFVQIIRQMPFLSGQNKTSILQPFVTAYMRDSSLHPDTQKALMGAALVGIDAAHVDNLLYLINRRVVPDNTLSISEKYLKQAVAHFDKAQQDEGLSACAGLQAHWKMFMEQVLPACSPILPDLLEYVRTEEAHGRIVGFHGNHEKYSLLRDIFTRLYPVIATADTPPDFTFFRFDRGDQMPGDEQRLAKQITQQSTALQLPDKPLRWSWNYPPVLFFTLSLFACQLGSSPLYLAAMNQLDPRPDRLPSLRSVFDHLGIPKLGEELEKEGLLEQLSLHHQQALGGRMGGLVTLSMTPAFIQKYAYAGGGEGTRGAYKWQEGAIERSSSNPATIAHAMKNPAIIQTDEMPETGARGLLLEEHCLVIPDALTNPDHVRNGDLSIHEFFPGLNKEAYARYETARDKIVSRVMYHLLFEGHTQPGTPENTPLSASKESA